MRRSCARHRSFSICGLFGIKKLAFFDPFLRTAHGPGFCISSFLACPDSGRLLTKAGPPASTQIHAFLAGPTLFFCQAASKRYQPIIMLQSCFPPASSFARQSMRMLFFGIQAVMRVVSSFLLHSRVIDVGEVRNLVGR